MTYMFILNCALKLVEEIILYYDARSKKHQNPIILLGLRSCRKSLKIFGILVQNLNPGPPAYEAEFLPTRTRSSREDCGLIR